MGRTGKTEKNVELTKRQIQALNTKNRIYDAAIKNFNEKGFNNVLTPNGVVNSRH